MIAPPAPRRAAARGGSAIGAPEGEEPTVPRTRGCSQHTKAEVINVGFRLAAAFRARLVSRILGSSGDCLRIRARGRSSNGRASALHAEGKGIDAPRLQNFWTGFAYGPGFIFSPRSGRSSPSRPLRVHKFLAVRACDWLHARAARRRRVAHLLFAVAPIRCVVLGRRDGAHSSRRARAPTSARRARSPRFVRRAGAREPRASEGASRRDRASRGRAGRDRSERPIARRTNGRRSRSVAREDRGFAPR